MFLVPKEAEMVPKAPQKAPKTVPKGTQRAVENRLDEKIPPGPSQRPILECFGVYVGAFVATFRICSVISSVDFSSCRGYLLLSPHLSFPSCPLLSPFPSLSLFPFPATT